MDGIDAVVVQTDGDTPAVRAFRTFPYPETVQMALRRCQREGRLEALIRLDMALGELFAAAALAVLDDANVAPGQVAVIGSHGQTLLHLPEASNEYGAPVRATLQIGDSAVVATRTGVPTVGDFRVADMALGGQGAPLVPWLDWQLFRSAKAHRVLLNIGGVANVTVLSPGAELSDVVAFDTGPGNVLIDLVARRRGLDGGIDSGGSLARSGTPVASIVEALLADPYYSAPPPKSADARQFELLLGTHDEVSTENLLASVTEVTARTVADAVRGVTPDPAEILVAGGGVHNAALMSRLATLLPQHDVLPLEEIGAIPADAKEAVAFALLAVETLARRPGNVPAATGASGPAVLGKVAWPPPAAG